MNFLQRLTSKSAAPDAYGSISLEENDTSSPQVDSFQDADNHSIAADHAQTPAVIIKDKLKGSPFPTDSPLELPPSSPSQIKSSSNAAGKTSNLFSSWSAAGQTAFAAITKKDSTASSKDSESEPAEGKLMGEIRIDWNYVTPSEPKKGEAGDDLSDDDRAQQTKKVLEEEVNCTILSSCFLDCLLDVVLACWYFLTCMLVPPYSPGLTVRCAQLALCFTAMIKGVQSAACQQAEHDFLD